MAKKKRKRWPIVLGLILVVIVGYNLMSRGPAPMAAIEPVKVATGPVVRRIAETGTIEMDRTVDVKSQVAGRILQLNADVGDTLKAGRLLAVIEPDPDKALQLSGKRASVTRAEMDLTEQKRLLDQKRQNVADGISPQEELERLEHSFKLSQINLAQQRLELQILAREVRAQARAMGATEETMLTEDYEIQAPIDGIVTARPVEEGELVSSAMSMNQGTALFTMGDPALLIVKVQISEVDIGEVAIGQECEIRVDALPGTTYRGRLRQLAPTGGIKQGSSVVSFDAEVEVLESDRALRSGMTADVDIIIGRVPDALFLPVEAVATVYKKDVEGELTEAVDHRIAYVKEEGGGWKEQRVTTGLESNSRVQILEGLTEGQEVHPDAKSRQDSSSKPTESAARGGGPRVVRRG